MSFWNKEPKTPKHNHEFGPWKIKEEGDLLSRPGPIFGEWGSRQDWVKCGNYLIQQRQCKDKNCLFVELNRQELKR